MSTCTAYVIQVVFYPEIAIRTDVDFNVIAFVMTCDVMAVFDNTEAVGGYVLPNRRREIS